MRKSFMRNLGLTGLTAALLLTGCAGTSSGNKTQEITDTTITASEAQFQEGSQSALNTSDDASGTDGTLSSDTSSEGQNAAASQAASQTSFSDIVTGDQAKDEETYYQVKAEKDAVEIDIENLEASFRIGTISQEDFTSQKADLKRRTIWMPRRRSLRTAWISPTARATLLSRREPPRSSSPRNRIWRPKAMSWIVPRMSWN